MIVAVIGMSSSQTLIGGGKFVIVLEGFVPKYAVILQVLESLQPSEQMYNCLVTTKGELQKCHALASGALAEHHLWLQGSLTCTHENSSKVQHYCHCIARASSSTAFAAMSQAANHCIHGRPICHPMLLPSLSKKQNRQDARPQHEAASMICHQGS